MEGKIEIPEVDERSRNRLKLVFYFFLFLFLIVILRLFYIQIINSEKYKKLAETQHIKKVEAKAKRGNIFDRNGIIVASSINARSFAIDPLLVKKDTFSLQQYYRLGKLLGFATDKLNSILNTKKRFIWLKRGLIEPPPEIDTISFTGLIKINEPKRLYLFGKTISNLIGVTNLDNIGISGLEFSFDSILKGEDGFVYFLKDARGNLHPTLELPSQIAKDGKDIRLTIDIYLQRLINYFLEKGVLETKSKGGCIIVMNPNNGEILALANYPSFDPSNLGQVDEENFNLYAVNFAFEPGSTIKPLIAAIGISRGIIDENHLFDGYNGIFRYGDIVIVDEHPANKLNLVDALVFSSNIAFAQISTLIPTELLEKDLIKLGFGKKTGVKLPGELKGYIKKGDTLTLIEQMFLGFGYGLFVTPLQLAVAYSAIANGGMLVSPKILMSDTNNVFCDTVFKKSVVERLKNILVKVVNEGTATATKIEGIEIAGKTGTSQKFESGTYSKTNYINSFIGFLPANRPKILVLILLDEPKSSIYASVTCVPIFKKIVLSMMNSTLAKYIFE
ncbi:MAG: penicillin-binding protein 2 [Ignavibacteria bacterium]|nr:penicillin-binding protein 2 [Ignavibacteria bacterium]